MNVALIPYHDETDAAAALILQFWQAHNHASPSYEEVCEDLAEWTRPGHCLYFICDNGRRVGFVHLGSRGAEMDWLEDIFVLPEFQGKGIGTRAIQLAEDIVKEYSESLFIEAAARNRDAIRLYQKLGYTCLNTVTVRKDFQPENYETIDTEALFDMDFHIKRYKN